jgi:hypothetical protein
LFKEDGQEMVKTLLADHVLEVVVEWAFPSSDDDIAYELWADFGGPFGNVFNFFEDVKSVAVALGDAANFTPHLVYYSSELNKSHQTGCTNYGRYCLSSSEFVKEALRRSCIWKEYGEPNGIGIEWWDYMAFTA